MCRKAVEGPAAARARAPGRAHVLHELVREPDRRRAGPVADVARARVAAAAAAVNGGGAAWPTTHIEEHYADSEHTSSYGHTKSQIVS